MMWIRCREQKGLNHPRLTGQFTSKKRPEGGSKMAEKAKTNPGKYAILRQQVLRAVSWLLSQKDSVVKKRFQETIRSPNRPQMTEAPPAAADDPK